MISKENLLKSLEDMPDKINVDELLDRILFIQKVEEGQLESAQGRITSHESFKNEMTSWFTSFQTL